MARQSSFSVSALLLVQLSLALQLLGHPVHSQLLPRPRECSGDGDCGKYHYCLHLLLGSKCVSNLDMETSGLPSYDCRGPRGFPDHSRCVGGRFSTERCFAEVGFNCRRSYFMPCAPGDEEGCTDHFRCGYQAFGNTYVPVCLPDKETDFGDSFCRSDFDCGYDAKLGRWQTCDTRANRCRFLIVD